FQSPASFALRKAAPTACAGAASVTWAFAGHTWTAITTPQSASNTDRNRRIVSCFCPISRSCWFCSIDRPETGRDQLDRVSVRISDVKALAAALPANSTLDLYATSL